MVCYLERARCDVRIIMQQHQSHLSRSSGRWPKLLSSDAWMVTELSLCRGEICYTDKVEGMGGVEVSV